MDAVSNLLRNFYLVVFFLFGVFRSTSLEYVTKTTKYGRVRGSVESVRPGKQIERFLGVPYASPPIKSLRFEVSSFIFKIFLCVCVHILKYMYILSLNKNVERKIVTTYNFLILNY